MSEKGLPELAFQFGCSGAVDRISQVLFELRDQIDSELYTKLRQSTLGFMTLDMFGREVSPDVLWEGLSRSVEFRSFADRALQDPLLKSCYELGKAFRRMQDEQRSDNCEDFVELLESLQQGSELPPKLIEALQGCSDRPQRLEFITKMRESLYRPDVHKVLPELITKLREFRHGPSLDQVLKEFSHVKLRVPRLRPHIHKFQILDGLPFPEAVQWFRDRLRDEQRAPPELSLYERISELLSCIPWPPTPLASATQEPVRSIRSPNRARRSAKSGTVNQRMMEHFQADPNSCFWTQRRWAEFLGCSPAAVAAAPAWSTAKAARAIAKTERLDRERSAKKYERGQNT